MVSWRVRTRDALTAGCGIVVGPVRSDRRYAAYPRYALMLAASVWFVGGVPADSDTMSACVGSPASMSLWCALSVAGAALAAALALVGVWRPGRLNAALSTLALALCCLPAV